jgi:hypothetical protein
MTRSFPVLTLGSFATKGDETFTNLNIINELFIFQSRQNYWLFSTKLSITVWMVNSTHHLSTLVALFFSVSVGRLNVKFAHLQSAKQWIEIYFLTFFQITIDVTTNANSISFVKKVVIVCDEILIAMQQSDNLNKTDKWHIGIYPSPYRESKYTKFTLYERRYNMNATRQISRF